MFPFYNAPTEDQLALLRKELTVNVFVVGSLSVFTGVCFLFLHHKTAASSGGNEGGVISFHVFGLPGLIQGGVGVLGSLLGLIVQNGPEWMFSAVGWSMTAAYFISLQPFVLYTAFYLHYLVTDAGLPSSFSTGSLVCPDCESLLHGEGYQKCPHCGSEKLIFCFTRWVFDWRKPSTWRKRWAISGMDREKWRGFGANGIWYGPDPPSDHTQGLWLGQEGVTLSPKLAALVEQP